MGSEELLNRMVEALGIIIDRRPKVKLRKMENEIIEKIGCVLIYYRPELQPELRPELSLQNRMLRILKGLKGKFKSLESDKGQVLRYNKGYAILAT